MKDSRAPMKLTIDWRRNKVLELLSCGYNQSDISRTLQFSEPTISRDIAFLDQQAKEELRNHIEDKVPQEYKHCVAGINQILRIIWSIAANTELNGRERIAALALANECYKHRMELATNSAVLKDSLKFIEQAKIDDITNTSDPVVKQAIKQSPIKQEEQEDTSIPLSRQQSFEENGPTEQREDYVNPDHEVDESASNDRPETVSKENEELLEEKFKEQIEDIQAPETKILTFVKEKEPQDIHTSEYDIQRQQEYQEHGRVYGVLDKEEE
jgi:hypothetical protein